MKRLLALALTLLLLLPAIPAGAIEDCHRVEVTKRDTTQENKSIIRRWKVDTVLDSVDEELGVIADEYVERLGPTLQKAKNNTSQNSRLDVVTRYSRTGLTWMSFLVQARVTYHRDLIGQEIQSRTFDMTTGERIWLTDIFDAESEGWAILEQAVREQAAAYWPEMEPDQAALEEMCTQMAISEMDFTLHGMSLVLHIPAEKLYPGKTTLMEITVMYPEIRPYMTERAQVETDNLAYYKTCALTFDDGPSRTNTSLTLNALTEAGARATFFVLGNRIGEYDDLVQREHDEGHAVASHNWNHNNVSKSKASTLRAMVAKCDNALIDAIGLPTRYNRVPYGLYNQMIDAKTGWPLIQWSVDTYDWRGLPTSTVLKRVKNNISDGDIILCHDIKDNTPKSAKAIADYLAEEGYMLLTIDELFAKDGVELKGDKVYYRCVDGDTSIKKEK
ncbi:MAG: hypothetical protein E7316_09890 [Clostridiales bacterium]|nr:hypothetical protein [Clostridiales bacterium]